MAKVWWFLIAHVGASLTACIALLTRTPPVDRTVFAYEIAKAYARDPNRADEEFKDRPLLVWGALSSPRPTSGGTYVAAFDAVGGVTVWCELSHPNAVRATTIAAGSQVGVYGVATGLVGNGVVLRECNVRHVTTSSDPAPTQTRAVPR